MADRGADYVESSGDPDLNLKIITEVFRPYLIKNFGVTSQFTAQLLSTTSLDNQVLKCDTTAELLDYLAKVNKKGTYAGFLQTLRHESFEGTSKYIADFIEGFHDQEAIEEEDCRKKLRHILEAFAPRLCEIPPDEILPYLVDIEMEEKQRVRQTTENKGDIRGATELFIILLRKGLDCFKGVIEGLRAHNHNVLADELSNFLSCDEDGDSCEKTACKGDTAPCGMDMAPGDMDTDTVVGELVRYSDCAQQDDNTSGMNSLVDGRGTPNVAGGAELVSASSPMDLNINASQEEKQDISAKDVSSSMSTCVEEVRGHGACAEADEDFESSPDIIPIELRNYQKELIAPALEGGRNAVIVAPTGSGKTVIAARLVKAMLDREPTMGPRTGITNPPSLVADGSNKVIFIVNKVPLVKQQSELFKKYIDGDRIMPLSGDGGHVGSLGDLLEHKDVLVMTAQLLVNALQGNREDNDRMDLSKIGLLILDECHHCQKGDPYNDVMAEYCNIKHSSPEVPRPQVLGLTASMGVGKSKTRYKAQTHILALLANLDAEKVCTVQDPANLEELQQKRDKPTEKIFTVRNRKTDVFKKDIRSIMRKIEAFIAETPGGKVIHKETSRLKCPPDPGCQVYEQWLVRMLEYIAANVSEEEERMKLVICVDNLQVFNNSLYINRDARTKDALEHLEKNLIDRIIQHHPPSYWEDRILSLFKERYQALKEASVDPANSNPLLSCLSKVLIQALAGKDQFRGILFCRTRAATGALLAWMQDTEALEFLKPGLLTGSGGTGMTQNQQTELLSRFRDGNHQLIIATSVAEEGLDIQQCNVVIRYNYISNDIGRVQAQGRNRAKDGKFFLITSEELNLHSKELMNKIREKIMVEVTQEIQAMEEEEFLKQIAQLQKVSRLERKLRLNSNIPKHRKTLMKVRLTCRRCSRQVCTADDIRCIQDAHHVVLSEAFEESSIFIDVAPRSVYQDMELRKRIVCGNRETSCTQEWGKQMLYKGCLVNLISPSNFVMVMPKGPPRIYKKWKDVPFTVRSISTEELDKICNESSSDEDESGEEMEVE